MSGAKIKDGKKHKRRVSDTSFAEQGAKRTRTFDLNVDDGSLFEDELNLSDVALGGGNPERRNHVVCGQLVEGGELGWMADGWGMKATEFGGEMRWIAGATKTNIFRVGHFGLSR